MNNVLDHLKVTDDQILNALMGETVVIQAPIYRHELVFVNGKFIITYHLGEIEVDEANLRLVRFI